MNLHWHKITTQSREFTWRFPLNVVCSMTSIKYIITLQNHTKYLLCLFITPPSQPLEINLVIPLFCDFTFCKKCPVVGLTLCRLLRLILSLSNRHHDFLHDISWFDTISLSVYITVHWFFSPIKGHPGSFQVLAKMSKAATSFHMHVFAWKECFNSSVWSKTAGL